MSKLSVRILSLLLAILLIQEASAQDSISLKGTVMDVNNQPVGGVSVSLLTQGAIPVITDTAGHFSILVPEGTTRLSLNSLDHTSKVILIEEIQETTIYLTPHQLTSGYEDVDIGNMSLPLKNLISPVATFNFDERKHANPEPNPGAFLQGATPGILSTSMSGMPGSGNYLMIRGMRSLFTNNQPLVIIDNIPMEHPGTLISRVSGYSHSPLTSINPLDITSMTLLKDAGAAIYYGLHSSNGVIIINTLDPTATQTTVDFTYRTGISLKPRILPQLDHHGFKVLANEILASSNLYEEEYELLYPGLYLNPGELGYPNYQHNTNWQDEVFNNSLMNQANLTVKGGDEISRYGLSVGFLDQGGSIVNSNYTSYNIRFTSYLKVYKWLEMNVNASLNNNSSSLFPSALEASVNPILNSLFKSPLLSPYNYDDNGDILQTTADIKDFGTSNPRAVVNATESNHVNNRFVSSINLKASVTSHLNIHSLVALNLNSLKEEIFRPDIGMADYIDGLAYSYSEANTTKLNSIFTNHYFVYDRFLGDEHRITGTGGFRLRTDGLEHDWGRAVNLPTNDEFSELQSGDNTLSKLGGYSDTYNTFATYLNGYYVFRDRYTFSAGASLDFSSRNGKENAELIKIGEAPLAPSYSVGAGWRVSNESFLQPADRLENLFLRVSYSMTGNDDIGNLNALDYYQQVRYRETSGLIPGILPNTNLRNEKSQQLNAGLDVSFIADRYRFSLDLFRYRTSDLLFFDPQAAYSGFQSRPENGGELVNKGIELGAFTRLFSSENLYWDVTLNLSFLDNEITAVDEDIITGFEGGRFISRSELPAATFYGYEFLGVYTSSDATGGMMNDRGIAYGGGDVAYKDITGPKERQDSIINKYDRTHLGSPIPDFYGQLSSRITYKNLSLDLSLYCVLGQKVFNYVRFANESMSTLNNQSIKTLQRWQKDGDDTKVPRASWGDPIGNTDFSSRWIENGSFLRLKNITLSYKVPQSFLLFRNALFFVSANNLLTWTPYLGYDPEFSFSYNPMEQGIDYGLMPQTKSFMLGVKLGL